MYLKFLKKKGSDRKKKYFKNNSHNISNFEENYKSTNLRSIINLKHKDYLENYTKTDHNPID